jgi:hypothetical protein
VDRFFGLPTMGWDLIQGPALWIMPWHGGNIIVVLIFNWIEQNHVSNSIFVLDKTLKHYQLLDVHLIHIDYLSMDK